MRFFDRERELALLSEIYQRPGAQFVVLYGRRRIGKTALLMQWQKNNPKSFLYWVAHQSSATMLLKSFSRAIRNLLPSVAGNFVFADWESALDQLFALAEKQRIVVALDEFPYLLQSVPEFAGLLQKAWDGRSAKSRLLIVLSGSHYHMMHDQFLPGRGTLYGRSTADLLLEEIDPDELSLFLPRYSDKQIVETYSIIGGVPKYLEMWDDGKPVKTNVRDLVLSPVTIFRHEALFLIHDKISEPRTYLAILESLGRGLKTPTEISKQTGVLPNHIGKYLHTLHTLGFIQRIISLGAPNPANTRVSRYEIRDGYLKFYFNFIYPNLHLLEQGRTDRLQKLIEDQFNMHVGKTAYEALARRKLINLGDEEQLSFIPDEVGRIWKRDVEIDVAAINRREQSIILGECKWRNRKVNEADLKFLQERSARLDMLKGWCIQYALFSKSGFTVSLQKIAASQNTLLFQGPDLTLVRGRE